MNTSRFFRGIANLLFLLGLGLEICSCVPDILRNGYYPLVSMLGVVGLLVLGLSWFIRRSIREGMQENVGGAQVYFTDPRKAPLVPINFYALEALKKSSNRDVFAEAEKSGKSFDMFDKVNGTDSTRKALQSGKSAREIVDSWMTGEETFKVRRKKYLLY